MWAEKHVHAPFLLGKQKYLLCFFLVSSFFKIQFLRCFETRCYKKQSKLILFLLEQVSCKFVSFYRSFLFFLFLFLMSLLGFFFSPVGSLSVLFFFSSEISLPFLFAPFFFFILAILLLLLQPSFLFVFPILLSLSCVGTWWLDSLVLTYKTSGSGPHQMWPKVIT